MIFILISDPCEDKYCGPGHECQASEDGLVAVCVCAKRCVRRHRPVCASNGKVYANHCELHRAACHLGETLTASRLMRCLHRGRGHWFSFVPSNCLPIMQNCLHLKY